jgi:hypothetical protein
MVPLIVIFFHARLRVTFFGEIVSRVCIRLVIYPAYLWRDMKLSSYFVLFSLRSLVAEPP